MKIKKLREEDALYKDIELTIDKIKRKKNIYSFSYKMFKVLAFSGGATITILTGWQKELFKPDNYVLVISSCITLLAAMEGLFGLKDKGVGYDIILFDLRRLRDKMSHSYLKDAALYNNERDSYFNNFQNILESQKLLIENSDNDE